MVTVLVAAANDTEPLTAVLEPKTTVVAPVVVVALINSPAIATVLPAALATCIVSPSVAFVAAENVIALSPVKAPDASTAACIAAVRAVVSL